MSEIVMGTNRQLRSGLDRYKSPVVAVEWAQLFSPFLSLWKRFNGASCKRSHLAPRKANRRIEQLNKHIIEDRRTQDERNRIESEIRAAELALVYYRKAFELEQQVG